MIPPADYDDLIDELLERYEQLERDRGSRPPIDYVLGQFQNDAPLRERFEEALRCLTAFRQRWGAPGPSIAGYSDITPLTAGGLGIVYTAHQDSLERTVALKSPSWRSLLEPASLREEARRMASVHHPNVVSVFDLVESDDGTLFLVMEYVQGGSLADAVQNGGCLMPSSEVATRGVELANALTEIHRQGLLHLDLKPSNVLIEADGTVKIADFGISRSVDRDDSHALAGTRMYMAPEIIRGDDPGVQTDVFGLGCILYELLSGSPPRDGTADNADVVPLQKRRQDVDRSLAAICAKCLNEDARGRYASAGEVAEDLTAFLRGDPISARPQNWFAQRQSKWRRVPAFRRADVTGIVALVGLSIAVSGLFLVNSQRVQATSRQAIAEANRNAERRVAGLTRRITESFREAYGHRDVAGINSAIALLSAILDEEDLDPSVAADLRVILGDAHRALVNLRDPGDVNKQRAIEQYQMAASLQTDHDLARHRLAILYYDCGMYEEAIASEEEHLRHHRQFAAGYNTLGNALHDQSRALWSTEPVRADELEQRAIAAYETAMSLDDDYVAPHYNLGNVFADAANRNTSNLDEFVRYHEMAIEQCQRANDINPRDPSHWINMGNSYRKLSRAAEVRQQPDERSRLLEEARTCFARALPLIRGAPDVARTLWLNAMVYKDDPDLALTYCQSASLLSASGEDAYELLQVIALVHLSATESDKSGDDMNAAIPQRAKELLLIQLGRARDLQTADLRDRLQTDPRFDHLRKDDDFRELVADLESR